jgi:hypothetical protein
LPRPVSIFVPSNKNKKFKTKKMKKLIVILSVFVIAMTNKVSAQAQPTEENFDIALPTVPESDGNFDIALPTVPESHKGRGTLTFFKKGNSFSYVIYKDAAGKSTRLEPARGGTNGAPKPECKTKLPDACFSSPDKNIGMCICKPGNLSTGGTATIRIRFASGNNQGKI